MTSLRFEGLPTYSWPGGSVTGTVVLEVDKPTRGQTLWVELKGHEFTQVTISRAKGSTTLQQESVFVEQTWDPGKVLSFVDPVHIAPGVYRAPFQFALPATAQPSLHTTKPGPWGGDIGFHRDGLTVEYRLEARLRVPLWADLVAQAILPVFSPRRILGVLPPMASPAAADRPSFVLGGSGQTPLLPGGTLRVAYQVENPAGKKLRSLRFTLTRIVEYHAYGAPGLARSPTLEIDQPLGASSPHFAGTVEIAVPNTEDATGPGQGELYQTFWTATVVLEVILGRNVELEVPLLPA